MLLFIIISSFGLKLIPFCPNISLENVFTIPPLLSGLEYFYPRMHDDGIILIHDYFTEFYHGVKAAVDVFEENLGHKLRRFPIGDGISIAIIK